MVVNNKNGTETKQSEYKWVRKLRARPMKPPRMALIQINPQIETIFWGMSIPKLSQHNLSISGAENENHTQVNPNCPLFWFCLISSGHAKGIWPLQSLSSWYPSQTAEWILEFKTDPKCIVKHRIPTSWMVMMMISPKYTSRIVHSNPSKSSIDHNISTILYIFFP